MMDMNELLDLAATRDLGELTRELQIVTAAIQSTGLRAPMTETQKLLDEAYWYARHDDLDEAIYRLEQASTFQDEDEDDEDYL